MIEKVRREVEKMEAFGRSIMERGADEWQIEYWRGVIFGMGLAIYFMEEAQNDA